MRNALRSTVPRTPPPIRRLRASLNPGGLRYRRALEGTSLVPRRFLPRARSAGRPLTSPVAHGAVPFETLPRTRAALPRSPVKSSASTRPETPSLDECPLDPLPLTRQRISTRARHRSPCFAAADPASGALSPSRPARREMARPRSLPNALHARALLATHRSSTSAIESDLQARPADLETRTRSGGPLVAGPSRDSRTRFRGPACDRWCSACASQPPLT